MDIIKASVLAACSAAGIFLISNSAKACCPDGGHGKPVATTGLGERAPAAANQALDPAWHIYEFQRDGVTYLQINDAAGTVRAAIGRIGGTMWVLPMGKDAGRVSLPSTTASAGSLVYRTSSFTVRVLSAAGEDSWMVTAAN